jgi:hypothetical protein
MILETTQIICTVINLDAGSQVTPYKNSHATNPIVKWARENRSKGSLCWLYELGIAYGEEIKHRFGRKHACQLVLEGLTFSHPWLIDLPKFMYGMDESAFYNGARHRKLELDFTHLPTFTAYKKYLKARWDLQRITPRKNGKIVKAKWTKRGAPPWR